MPFTENENTGGGQIFVCLFQGVTFGYIEFEVPGIHLRSFSHPVSTYDAAQWNRRELW